MHEKIFLIVMIFLCSWYITILLKYNVLALTLIGYLLHVRIKPTCPIHFACEKMSKGNSHASSTIAKVTLDQLHHSFGHWMDHGYYRVESTDM